MEYEKPAMPFSGCFTKSEDVYVRTERKKQKDNRSMQFLCTYPQQAVFWCTILALNYKNAYFSF